MPLYERRSYNQDRQPRGVIKIKLNGDVLFVSIAIVLKEGASAVETAERVQSTIKSAVQNTLGMAVARVDVKIVDIEV